MDVHLGTSGFSYPEWKGRFYPDDLPDNRMLPYYSERFSSVEINNSFYRMPSTRMLSTWAAEVPRAFRFVLKASRRITHIARLKEEANDSVAYFFSQSDALGERLGPVLFQLPPNLKKDVPRLARFLATLPPGHRAAFEFRHPSWFDDEVYETLRAAGAALCVAEDEQLATPLVPTTDWGYLRLRRQDYTTADLERWASAVAENGRTWTDAYVFFKHEDAARGPALAREFESLLPATSPR